MNNPMYEAQLNRHEDAISDINGRLHSYDLALRWCEEQIKRIPGEDNYCRNDVEVTEKVWCTQIEKEYDELKHDHNLLKEAYVKLDDRYAR